MIPSHVTGIPGCTKASETAMRNYGRDSARIYYLQSVLYRKLAQVVPDLQLNGHLTADLLVRLDQDMRAFDCQQCIYLKMLKATIDTLSSLALEEISYTTTVKKIAITPELLEKARKAKAILDRRLNNPPSLAELARLCISNVHSIQVAFKHCFSSTIHEYSLEARLAHAKQLLLHEKLNLDSIADETGFYDGPALAKFFKSRTGSTPGEFRKYERTKRSSHPNTYCNVFPLVHLTPSHAAAHCPP